MTETVSDETAVISSETTSEENIVAQKTIVYETLVDPAVIKIAGKNLKDRLFTRFGFLKPKPEEVQIVSIDKYYKPYILVSGRYLIDYYRKRVCAVKVAEDVSEVIFNDQTFKPKHVGDSSAKGYNAIELEGEERLIKEARASLTLDESGQDVALKELSSAPSEKNPEEVLARFSTKEVPPDTDLDMLRSRICKRPADINRIANELFEVSERVIIYTPRFRVLFKNVKTGEKKLVEFDGVTARKT